MTFSAYLASASPQAFLGWSLAFGALAAAGFAGCFVFLRRARLLEDMPTARVRSAAQGYVELEGVARLMAGEPIICPLTATRCVWWRFKVEEKRTEGRNTRWVAVNSGASDDCFLLDDGSGACVVDPTGASVIPTLRRCWYGYSAQPDISPEMGKGWWRTMWCKYRYVEELILSADPVYVLGTFRTQTGIAEACDEQADLLELLNKWKHDPKMMAMFDLNKDGSVDQREWEAARRAGLTQVRRAQVERAVATPDLNVLARPRDGRPFILSGVPQAQLVRRYREYAAACLGGMVLMAGMLLWALRARGVTG